MTQLQAAMRNLQHTATLDLPLVMSQVHHGLL